MDRSESRSHSAIASRVPERVRIIRQVLQDLEQFSEVYERPHDVRMSGQLFFVG